MYNNRVRNIELPENLFSNLGEIKRKKLDTTSIYNTEDYKKKEETLTTSNTTFDTDVKLTNYSNRKEYRDRIDRMYEEVKEIIPIDNEIDNVLFFNNYVEKGIVIKPKISSLKQFWTEYRLINNEKKEIPKLKNQENEDRFDKNIVKTEEKDLSNFDKLFEALSQRVEEINNYIEELKEMRTNIAKTSKKLENEKEKLESERNEFNSYKQKEENKLNKEKENLKINFARLQTIIDDLDNKLTFIDEKNN